MSEEAIAWREVCERMAALGDRLLDESYPTDPLDRTAGFVHLTEQLMCWIEWLELIAGERGQIELPDGAVMISIREYYFDWNADQPALFTIECLDDDALDPAPRLSGFELATRMRDAANAVETSLDYWNTYMRERR